MKLDKKQYAELMQVYETWWYSYLNGDVKTYDSFLADDYHFVGSTNGEEYLNRKDTTAFFVATAHQIAGKAELRNLKRTIEELDGGLILITDLADAYVISEPEWVFYSRFRFTSIMKETTNGWRFIYQHFSAPDTKAQEGETLGTEQITKENQELRDAIKRRTVELEYKNRELEIEAATERVRVQSMAMQHPHDLEKVNKELFTQLTKLEIAGLSGVSFYFVDPDEIVTVWDLSSPGNLNDPNRYSFRFDSKKFPILGGFVEILNSTQEDYFVLDFPKEKLLQGIEELKDIDLNIYNNYKHAFESGALQHQWNPAARITDGILSIDLIKPPADDTKTIVLKMAGAFNQAYQRFLDLQKAEAQAKESQIELGLERVRARAMAMQHSNELADLVDTIFKELTKLDFAISMCIINIIDESTLSNMVWGANPDTGKPPESYYMKFEDYPFHHAMMKGYKERAAKFIYVIEGEEKKIYDEYLFNETEFRKMPLEAKAAAKALEKYVSSFSFSNFGGLQTVGDKPLSDINLDILARFGKVFDLTYTRFNDLKIAEAHSLQAEEDLIKLQTEKKRAEDALGELKTTQAQLIQAEKMASLGELTAGIAHEIQNPLNFVNNFSEVSNEMLGELKEELGNNNLEEVKGIADDVQQNLTKILHHGKRADGIVKGMLQHSRSSSGVKEPTDINALVDEYLRLVYHGLKAKDNSFNASLQTHYDATIGEIEVVPQDIGRVVLNLISNAFYACTERIRSAVNERKKLCQSELADDYQPKVSVSTKKVINQIEISVADNGNGIPESVVDKIFQPFFTTKPTGEGTGLGLSLSYDIIKAHDGELKVVTPPAGRAGKEDGGAEFKIILPITIDFI